MKKIIASMMIAAFLVTGCTGSFTLSKKLYNYHRAQEKWVDEAMFLVCIILPVYGATLFIDGIVLNSVEFWTGRNPVALNDVKDLNIARNGSGQAVLSYNGKNDTLNMSILSYSRDNQQLVFEKTESGVVAKDSSGTVRFTAVTNADGTVSLFDGNQQLLQTFSKASVEDFNKQLKG